MGTGGILPVRCPSQDTSVHEEVQDGLAGPRVRGEPLLRIWQCQTQSRRVKKGLLERDDEILNLAAVIGNHLFHPQSLKRRGLTTAPISKPRTRFCPGGTDFSSALRRSPTQSGEAATELQNVVRQLRQQWSTAAKRLRDRHGNTTDAGGKDRDSRADQLSANKKSLRDRHGTTRCLRIATPAPTLADTSFTARIEEHSRPLELT